MYPSQQLGVAWIGQDVVESVAGEADQSFPRETGGVLMGYWTADKSEVVITSVIGPGPNAIHGRSSFSPDAHFQEQAIAERYALSGRRHTYLGDWHVHPNAKRASLSWKDLRTMARIASCPEARAPSPLMAIVYGTPLNWRLSVWVGQVTKSKGLFSPCRMQTHQLALKIL